LTEETKQATPITEDTEQQAAVTVAEQPEETQAEEPAIADEAPTVDEPSVEAIVQPETAAAIEEVAEAPAAEAAGAAETDAVAEAPVDADADTPEATIEVTPVDETASAEAPEAMADMAAAQDSEAAVGEPMTMAELMDHPDNEVKSLKHGDVVEGTVVRIDPDEILVDFGGKSEGVVSNRELMNRRGPRDGDESRPEIQVGNEVLVYVLQPESPEGHAVLSLRRAGLERKWRAMQERFDAGEIVEARVIDHNKGGLIVDLGVRGFVPISQIVDCPRRPRD
jgi:DNA-directed RNA polymerase subunit E'/Rpb7